MSMTREEAIETLENHTQYFVPVQDLGALNMAISALRTVSREQVEKVWRGCSDCARKTCATCIHFVWAPRHCVDCENQSKWVPWNFCPVCGKPLTDEAVQMVMERLEVLKDGKDD